MGQPDQPTLFDPPAPIAKSANPCVQLFGPGPGGRTCSSCNRLIMRQWDKTYYKCELRQNTRGSKTDHRVNWPACAKWEQRQQ